MNAHDKNNTRRVPWQKRAGIVGCVGAVVFGFSALISLESQVGESLAKAPVVNSFSNAEAGAATVRSGGRLAGQTAAQDGPRTGLIVSFQTLVSRPDGQLVLDIRGKPKDPNDVTLPVISSGTVMISPRLCEYTYRLGFAFTQPSGHVGLLPYEAKVHDARLDGRPRPCPYSGLPRRGLRSFEMLITIDGERLMVFNAKPRTRTGVTFSRLLMPTLRYYLFTTPSGLARVRVRARYRTGRVYVATFLADVTAPPIVPRASQ